MLIAHTQSHSTLPTKKVGDLVNLEADVLAKYTAKSIAAVVARVEKSKEPTALTLTLATGTAFVLGAVVARVASGAAFVMLGALGAAVLRR